MTTNLLVINTSYLVKDLWASSDGTNIPVLCWNRSQKHFSHSSILLLLAPRACLQGAVLDKVEDWCSHQQSHIPTLIWDLTWDFAPFWAGMEVTMLQGCFWGDTLYTAAPWETYNCDLFPSPQLRVPTTLLGNYSCSFLYTPRYLSWENGWARTELDWMA